VIALIAHLNAVFMSEFVRKAWRANRSGSRGKVVKQLICNSKKPFCAVFQDVAHGVFQS
jgi:hypothetical protein